MPLPILIPAAGLSRRLGRPKQFERIDGVSLLRRAAERAIAAKLGTVHVLLGHAAEACRAELAGLDVRVHEVPDFAEGMAATLRHGVAAVAGSDALLITLVDQLSLTSHDLSVLATLWRSSDLPMAAAQYADGSLGPPAIFSKAIYPQLLQLTGDQGARRILRQDPAHVLTLSLPNAEADFDE